MANSLATIDKANAKKKLTTRLKQLVEKHGFTYNKVFMRNQKTRWGSCSRKNNISLNMRIARLPGDLIDYVIMHELVHTRVRNHSPDFWAALSKLGIDGKEMAPKLRKHQL